eukprot:TRINITY_DN11836_c0_g1_i1.p1 TRINITY_DN11836_c0_g1~~TRINITY_DN11836_c0_g1_i1.p1  ORF type:complete len:670 (-),score=165.62 TRINITY_DN11836_c0_g1_i1:57-2066(-)
MSFRYAVCVVVLFIFSAACAWPVRLAGSPYPLCAAGVNSTRTLYPFNGDALSATQLLTAQTLQGLLARQTPTLYRVGANTAAQQHVWLDDLVQRYGVQVDNSVLNNFTALLTKFGTRQYVLWDSSNTASVSAALAIAAATEFVVVAAVDEATVRVCGYTLGVDSRTMSLSEVIQRYPLRVNFSEHTAVLQDPAKFDFLSDYSTFARAITWFDTDPKLRSNVTTAILDSLDGNSAIFGWGSAEGDTVDVLGQHAAYIHASDWAPNLSVFSNFYVENFAQAEPAKPELDDKKRNAVTPKHTVCFLMTDGDNIQWLVTGFDTEGGPWFGNPSRGKVPLGWTVSPAMAEVAPSLLAHFYETAVPGMDEFVAGPSGVGYTIPDKFSTGAALDAFAQLTAEFMQRADLQVLNIINDASGSASVDPFLQQTAISAVFDYYGDCYTGAGGDISWSNGKPIVGGRAAFWGSGGGCQHSAAQLAQVLRLLPKDLHNPQSYSLVPVHVWTHNVSEVVELVAALGQDYFDVLTPSQFVAKLSANVFHNCDAAPKATGSYAQSCSRCTDSCGSLQGCECSDGHGGSIQTAFFDHTVCQSNEVAVCNGMLLCQGNPCVCGSAAAGSYSGTCSECRDVCGVLVDCQCDGPGGKTKNAPFDSLMCGGNLVANCDGALLCQGQPCL